MSGLYFQDRKKRASRRRAILQGFALSFAVLAICFAHPLSATRAVPLHTQGAYIVDSKGYRVRLNAVNWYGAEDSDFVVMGLQAESLSNIVNEIESRGFNAVRLPWSNQVYESNPVVGDYVLTAQSQPRRRKRDDDL